jgi:hypothetical protein
VQLRNAEELENWKNKGVLVIYFGLESRNYETFIEVAKSLDYVQFAHTFEEELI